MKISKDEKLRRKRLKQEYKETHGGTPWDVKMKNTKWFEPSTPMALVGLFGPIVNEHGKIDPENQSPAAYLKPGDKLIIEAEAKNNLSKLPKSTKKKKSKSK